MTPKEKETLKDEVLGFCIFLSAVLSISIVFPLAIGIAYQVSKFMGVFE